MTWTDDKIERLKELWATGATASAIARMMGDGMTRNSVISKAWRLKLEPRLNPIRQQDTLFEMVCDRVIDAPLGAPMCITKAAEEVGMNATLAQRLWNERVEATHGGKPA